jgi:glycerol-3-phosphate acyltransferase PlsY
VYNLPFPARLMTTGVFGYAVGCLNAGYYLVRARRGTDLRAVHSGNAGATNAGRVLGRGGFVAVLLLDAAKGVIAAAIGQSLAGYAGAATGALASIAGHIWPAQLRFRGGKGIATTIGAFVVVEPLTVTIVVAIALSAYGISRRWSESGLATVLAAPLIAWGLGRPPEALAVVGAAAYVVLIAHRQDLRAWRASRTL